MRAAVERRALVEHSIHFPTEHPGTPTLDTTHLRVELPFEGILDREEQREVSPSQLSQQCPDNLRIGKYLGELDHPSQTLLAEAAPMTGLQLSRHRCDNLRAVLGELAV